MIPIKRRVVTDGEVFRVQFATAVVVCGDGLIGQQSWVYGQWQFYPGDHEKRHQAQAALDRMENEEWRSAPERWREV